MNYIVISPVRNEARLLPKTIESLTSQIIRPQQWVVVNDGSTDDTPNILASAAQNYPWMKVVQRADRGFRQTGAGVIEAFNDGVRPLGDWPWDLVVKLDCDLSFDRHYFAHLIDRFSAEERLGIASGVYLEQRGNGDWHEIVMPEYHAAGACKVIRRACFEEIGGFLAERGWDTVDEIRAIARGWRTAHFRDLQMKHWKPEGSGIGQWRTNLMLGEIYYLTRGSKMFFALKVCRRFLARPLVVAGLGMICGYFKTALKRQAPLVNAEEGRCYRALLRRRLRTGVKRLLFAS